MITVNKDTFQVSTPTETEIRMTRLFDAPRKLVFDVMSRPEHVRRWWGCLGEGFSVPVCEIDLRVGGKWRFVNEHPQGKAAFHGEYLEIDPPGRGSARAEISRRGQEDRRLPAEKDPPYHALPEPLTRRCARPRAPDTDSAY